jgi:hypothetical protein
MAPLGSYYGYTCKIVSTGIKNKKCIMDEWKYRNEKVKERVRRTFSRSPKRPKCERCGVSSCARPWALTAGAFRRDGRERTGEATRAVPPRALAR